MSWWRHPDLTEDELDAELRDHIERQVAHHVRAGLSPREARRRARLEFGGLDHVKEMCRDVRGTRCIEDLGRDLRHALRRQFSERRSGVPLFAVAALAIGIGASTAMFGVLAVAILDAVIALAPDGIARIAAALRRALGANRSRVLAELLRTTLACVSTGLCAGMLLALATGRTLRLSLFETRLADPWILVAVCALVLGVSLAACSGPAARVSRLDVGAVLRQ